MHRSEARLWGLAISLGFVGAAACPTRLSAQATPSGCAADSVRRARNPDGAALFFYAIPIAPSALIPAMECADSATLSARGPVRDVLLYVSASAGLADGYAHTESAELHYRHLYLAFRNAHQDPSTELGYREGRIGYLSHAGSLLEGGVTAGYRASTGSSTRGGPELAFPLRVNSRRWSALFESSYVLDAGQAYWNYRLEADYPLHGGPIFLGWLIDANELPIRNRGQVRTAAVGMVVGLTGGHT